MDNPLEVIEDVVPDSVPNSILNTIKKMLGVEIDDYVFDTDIVININSAFMILNQIGVGPVAGFSITGSIETWSDFLGAVINLAAIKTYIYLKVRMSFDLSTNTAAVIEALDRQIKELEWRLNVQAEQGLYIVAPVLTDEENIVTIYWE